MHDNHSGSDVVSHNRCIRKRGIGLDTIHDETHSENSSLGIDSYSCDDHHLGMDLWDMGRKRCEDRDADFILDGCLYGDSHRKPCIFQFS